MNRMRAVAIFGTSRGGRLIEFGVAVGADDRGEIDVVAGDVGHHVGDDAEGRHGLDPVRRHARPRGIPAAGDRGQDGQREAAVHRSFPFSFVRIKLAAPAASSETP